MTQPEPTPGAPAAPTDPQPVTPPVPADPAPAPEDITALPDWAQKAIRDARAEAAKSRTTAKQTAAEQARQETLAQVAKALGMGEEGKPVDPAELTAQIEQAQSIAFRSAVETQMYRLAGKLGGDAESMLDSNRFMDDFIDELDAQEGVTELNSRSREFAEAVEKAMAAALERNPRFKAAGQAPAASTAPRPDPSQGPKAPGAPSRPTSLHDAVKKSVAATRAPGG